MEKNVSRRDGKSANPSSVAFQPPDGEERLETLGADGKLTAAGGILSPNSPNYGNTKAAP